MKREAWRAAGAAAVWAVAASATLLADTVTVNPPAGSVTNAFVFVSGEDTLAVNTGATAGCGSGNRRDSRILMTWLELRPMKIRQTTERKHVKLPNGS